MKRSKSTVFVCLTFVLAFAMIYKLRPLAVSGAAGNINGKAVRTKADATERNYSGTVRPSAATLQPDPLLQPTAEQNEKESEESAMTKISIAVGESVFSAELYDNESARAFAARLPMTINMGELNGNEKYYYMPEKLTTAGERVGSIRSGDLMLYGSDCLVLFYESFSTSYSYTRLGYMEDSSGLAAALGGSSVQVTFSIND